VSQSIVYVCKEYVKSHTWSTISGRFLKFGFLQTLMTNIAQNPLRFDDGFGSELQTRIKKRKKNMADVYD